MGANDSATIYQGVQLGLEATAGTAVPANRRLQSVTITPAPQMEISTQKASGSKGINVSSVDAEWDQPTIGGKPTFTEVPLLLASVVQKQTAGELVDGTAGVYDWLFRPNTYDEDTFATYTLETGSKKRAEHMAGFLLTALGFSFPRRGEPQLSGGGIARRMEDNKLRYLVVSADATAGTFTITVAGQTTTAIAYNASAATVQTALVALSNVAPGDVVCSGGPLATSPVRIEWQGAFLNELAPAMSVTSSVTDGTATLSRLSPSPTALPLIPISGKHISVYGAAAHADLDGATRMGRALNVTWNIGNRSDAIWTLNDTLASYADTVEADPEGALTIQVGADDEGMDFLNTIRKDEAYFIRIHAVGPVIETAGGTTYRHELRIDTCLRYLGMTGKESASGGIVARTFNGGFAHDDTWGYMYEIFVRTTTAAL
jgi:hypothetical protein